MKKRLLSILTSIFVASSMLGVTAFAKAADLSGNVTASGSSALLPIVKQAADEFMKKNPGVTVQVSAGGSGAGLQQVKDGVVNIGNSDVFAEDNSGLTDHQVAIAPFLFVVNPDVKVTSLTKEQLIGIYTGRVKNWKEVGGQDEKIAVVMRQASSGTRMTIQKLVMGTEVFTNDGVVQESSGAVRATVANTPGSIGYIDLAYVDSSIKAVSYNGVAPTIENVKNGKYTLASFEHMYTKGEATGAAKAFIEYVQSKDFQSRVLPVYKFVSASDKIESKVIKIKATQTKSSTKKSTKKTTKK